MLLMPDLTLITSCLTPLNWSLPAMAELYIDLCMPDQAIYLHSKNEILDSADQT